MKTKVKGIVVFLCLLLVFMQAGVVFADDQVNNNQESVSLPTLTVSNLTFTQTGLTTKGSFDVENAETYFVGNLTYITEVYKGKEIADWELVNKTINSLQLDPKENKTVSFVHTLPANVSSGTFHMTVTILSRTGLPLGFAMKDIGTVQGSNDFLDSISAEDAIIDADGKDANPLSGSSYAANASPTTHITFVSASSKVLSAHPQVTVYERDYSFKNQPVKTVTGEKIEFQPKEQKNVEIKLPGIADPESYLAVVTMVDDSGKQISDTHEFRFVVEGASAKILSVQAALNQDKNKLNVSAMVIGPADGSDITGALVGVKLYNDNTNVLIKEESKTVDLGTENATVNLEAAIDNKVPNIRVETNIKYQDKILDTNTLKISNASLTGETEDPDEPAISPSDVVGTQYEASVEELIEAGIITGYPDGTFRPEQSITRAEFVKIVSLLLNKQSDINKLSAVTKFKDVKKNHWAGKYINSAVSGNLVKGYPGGTFKPENNVTYAEAVTVLVRLLGYQKEMDQQGGKWPDNYIAKGSKLGVTVGISMDKPSSGAKRGDIAVLVANTLDIKNGN